MARPNGVNVQIKIDDPGSSGVQYVYHPAARQQRPDSEHVCQANGVLMKAIESEDFDVAQKVLLANPSLVHVPCGPLKVTALQLAASQGENGIKFAQLFLDNNADPNLADKLGRTALHNAASSGSQEMVNLLLKAGASVNSRFEVSTLTRPKTMVGTLERQRAISDEVDYGFFDFFARKSEIECPDIQVGCKLPVPDCWGRTPLHQAVKGGNASCVQSLISGGANVNASDESGLTPLLLAGAGLGADDSPEDINKYELIVEMLVGSGAGVNERNEDTGTTPLHHAAALCSAKATRRLMDAGAAVSTNKCGETVLHEAAKQACPQVVHILLEGEAKLMVNVQDQVGRTPLHCAAYAGARESLSQLIRYGGDLSVTTRTGVSVMDAIFTNIPRPLHFLSDELDKCVVPNSATPNDRTFKVNIDFSLLAPATNDQQMAVVTSLTQGRTYYQLSPILQHPIVETFLRLKWRQLRVFFSILLSINFCFVVALSFYVVMLTYRENSLAMCFARRILISSASAILLYLLIQVFVLPKHYLREIETWISVSCAVMSLVVSIYGEYDHLSKGKKCTKMDNEMPEEWVMHVTSFAVLLAWAELMLLLGRFPTWGLYALMFYTVLQNVFKVLLVFVCLVIGFSFSFSIQFYQLPEFGNPWKAFVKTTVMMMGEYEFDDIFKMDNVNVANITKTEYVHLVGTSRFIFLLFIVLTSIVLMNLMVGLAVSDIQALEQESHIRIRLKQADFIAHLEKFTSHEILICDCIPSWVVHLLARRRRIDTCLVVQPAVFATWTHKINNTLIENIVNVALKNQSKGPPSGANAERRRGYSRASSGATAAEHESLVSLLLLLQQEVSEIKDIIELDRMTGGKTVRHNIGGDLNSSTYDVRTRKMSRTPTGAARFSEIVQGLQTRHPNFRSVKSSRPELVARNNIL